MVLVLIFYWWNVARVNQNQGRQGAERGKREGVRGRENKRMGEPNTAWLVVFAGTNFLKRPFQKFSRF